MAERSEGRRRERRAEGPGDHDVPYTFGSPPTADRPSPFSLQQYTRLLFLRGRLQDGACAEDRDARFTLSEHYGVVWVESEHDTLSQRPLDPNTRQ